MTEMTEQQKANIETVQYALNNALVGNIEILQPVISDDFVIYEAEGLPFGGVFRGMEGYIQCMTGINSFWTNKNLAPPEFVPAGDNRILMLSHFEGDITKNGEHVSMPTVSIWTFKDGKIETVRPFFFDTKHVHDRAQL